MKTEFNLIYDECLSEPIAGSLRPFLEKAEVTLNLRGVVSAYQRQGVPDAIWIPRIAAEQKWIVLSADRGSRNRHEGPEEKLPYLCRLHRVTHVLLSGTVHGLKAFEKGQAIVALWPEILTVNSCVRGTRFIIKKKQRGAGFF